METNNEERPLAYIKDKERPTEVLNEISGGSNRLITQKKLDSAKAF
ncbi:MAG: hypothetical protein JJT82_05965 [Legionellaceae bacterium]|nr:hypothetical protein [Legionellaceae bacterium]